jgi:phosphotransferase system HPr (HPr) family protein
MGFESAITVGASDREADAKSLLAVLGLGATGGTELRLRAEGEDAEAALAALTETVSGLTE